MPSQATKKKLRKILIALDPSQKADLLVEQLKEDTTDNFNENINELVKKISAKFQEIKKSLLDEFDSRLMQLPDVTDELKNLRSEFETKLKTIEKEDIGTIQTQMQDMVSHEIDTDENLKEELGNKIEDVRKEFLRRLANLGGGSQNQRIQIGGTTMSTRYADFNLIAGAGAAIAAVDNNTTKQVDITFTANGTIVIGTTVITGATQGSILFVGVGGVIQEDNANLFYDDTLNSVGIGMNAPNEAKLYVKRTVTNPAQIGGLNPTVINSSLIPTITSANAISLTGMSGAIHPIISTGITANASYSGVLMSAVRDNASDLGTLAQLRGLWASVGHSTPGATATTNIAYGILVQSYAQAGTITDLYGIYLQGVSGGGTLTNSYGIYIAPLTGGTLTYGIYTTTGNCVFGVTSGNVGIGTATPTYDLSFGGDAQRIIWVERSTVNPGSSLVVEAGSAKPSATNQIGGDLFLKAGIGTGNAQPAKVIIKAPSALGSSGTSDQATIDRVSINGTVNLSSGVAATMFTISLKTTWMGGGMVIYTVEASDGTDMISASGSAYFSAVNKAGTYTNAVGIVGTEVQALSDATDTITNTFSFSNGTNLTNFQITSTVTGQTPTTHRVTFVVISNGQRGIILA